MTASQIIFYVLAAFILGTAVLAVTTRKIFRSAIWLLFPDQRCWPVFLAEVEFIAAVQVVVYVGGIVVLIISPSSLPAIGQGDGPAPRRGPFFFSVLAVPVWFRLYLSAHPRLWLRSGQQTLRLVGTQDRITDAGHPRRRVCPAFEVVSMLLLPP